MKYYVRLTSMVMLTAAVSACSAYETLPPPVESQQVSKQTTQRELTQEEMHAKWQTYATPSEGHEKLKGLVGNWKYTSRWWMKPDSQPDVSKGTSENRMILGGRFLEQTVKGKAMGQPFEGRGITGFDNVTKEFNSIWIDNMGTGIMASNGTYNHAANKIEERGTLTCPFNGKLHVRGVWDLSDKNRPKYETFMKDNTGREFRSMELIYENK